jgi:hypothetical protein
MQTGMVAATHRDLVHDAPGAHVPAQGRTSHFELLPVRPMFQVVGPDHDLGALRQAVPGPPAGHGLKRASCFRRSSGRFVSRVLPDRNGKAIYSSTC